MSKNHFNFSDFLKLEIIKFGLFIMKSSQSNFNLRSQGSYLVLSYLITTVYLKSLNFTSKARLKCRLFLDLISLMDRLEPDPSLTLGKSALCSFWAVDDKEASKLKSIFRRRWRCA